MQVLLLAAWHSFAFLGLFVGTFRGRLLAAALLAAAGIDALNMHHSDWNGGLTTLVHRFGVHAFAWDCQFDRVVAKMLVAGVDGIYGDHVEEMTAALRAWTR